MADINTCISNVNELVETCIIFDDSLKMSSRQFVWSRSQGITIFLDCTNEFFFQKRDLFHNFLLEISSSTCGST